MTKITAYLGRTLFSNILLAMILLVGIECLFSLVNESRFIGRGEYTWGQALYYVLLSLPGHIAEMFPMSALVGTLLGLGTLASHSELIVLRAAGLSKGNIIHAVLKLGIFWVIGIWLLGEGIAPLLDKHAHQQKAIAISGGQALRTTHGIWLRDGDDFVHIESLQTQYRLEGVTRYHFDQAMNLKKASFAKFATYTDPHWLLHEVEESYFNPDKIIYRYVFQQKWASDIEPEVLNLVGVTELEELSLVELWQTMRYRQHNELDARPYQLAFWQKIVRPFTIIVMMFLAIPFIFGPLRSKTMGLQIAVGILVGFCFHTLSELCGPLALVYQFPPPIAAILAPSVFFLMGIVLLRRTF